MSRASSRTRSKSKTKSNSGVKQRFSSPSTPSGFWDSKKSSHHSTTASKSRSKSRTNSSRSSHSSRSELTCATVEPVKANAKSMTFTAEEKELLDQLAGLYVSWGYRTKDGDHERYEDETHNGLRKLQEFTDILFRNLQQYHDMQRDRIFNSDVSSKAKTCAVIDFSDYEKKRIKDLLSRFLAEHGNTDKMKRLAHSRISKKNSLAFASLVVAARAIICLSLGEFQKAKNHMNKLSKKFN